MIDAFIIDYIKRKRKKDQEDRRIPLYIDPPELDGYREDDSRDKGKGDGKGYIEIDIYEDSHDEPNVIKM